MANERKNIISKIDYYINNISPQEREFWGPTAMILGAATIVNIASSSVPLWLAIIIDVIGTLLFLCGFWQTNSLSNKGLLLARIGITIGYAVFLLGIHFKSSYPVMATYLIAVGLLLMVLGIISYYYLYRAKKNKDKQRK
jgi:hypothetical protein